MTVRDLLATALTAGMTFIVRYGGEVDYVGQNIDKAMDAIEACDEMEVHFFEEDEPEYMLGWALIINDLDEDEKIADCSGIVNKWLDEETR